VSKSGKSTQLRLTNDLRSAAYSAAPGSKKLQSGFALCAIFFHHIFAVAEMLRISLSQPQKRRKSRTLYAILQKYCN
jgi:hypothetical protein